MFRIEGLAVLALVLATPSMAQDQPSLAQEVAEGCSSELTTYCEAVTPGEGRILACLYAHEDKLSGQCQYALYDAAVRLERAINAITYVANECRADIESTCAGVQAGEGRIAQCLDENRDSLSDTCTSALTEVGFGE